MKRLSITVSRSSRNGVTKKFTVTASPEVMDRFEGFLAMLHYNGGHSGNFGIEFDGDGADFLRVTPQPPKLDAKGAGKIAGVGYDLELARGNGRFSGKFFGDRGSKWYVEDGELHDDGNQPGPD